ncbi:MAG: hypothetical protein ACRENK_00190 [Gemmatimonadaceae bacterium]
MLCRLAGFPVLLAVIVCCSHDETASAHSRTGSDSTDDGVPPRPSVIAPEAQPYKIVAVVTGGTINGTVDFDGTPPAQPVIRPTSDQKICGNTITQKTLALSGTRVGDAVVWITDIRSGKAFPLQRRFDLTNDNCTLDPYVQVISTNSTLDVSNDDRTLHTNRFINVGTGQIAGIAPFNDDGEVVPVDELKEPAEIEVVCQEHPWTHAWIAVLDHPYYAQTSATGTFTIDDVPPGRYRIRAWHPLLGFADDSVTVVAGQHATVAFRIRPTAATAPTVPTQPKPEPPTASTTAPAVPILPTASSTSASSTPATPPPR